MKRIKLNTFGFLFFSTIYSFSWLVFLYSPNALEIEKGAIYTTNRALSVVYLTMTILIIHFLYKIFDFSKITRFIFFSGVVIAMLTPMILLTINSTDLYSYITRGRVYSIFQENPYITPYIKLNDPNFKILQNVWSSQVPAYAPLYIIIIISLSSFFTNTLIGSIYFFKIVFSLIFLLTVIVFHKITDNNMKSTFLYAFHPLLLFETVNNNHVSVFVLLFVLISIYFLKQKSFLQRSLSLCVLVLSVFIKYFTAMFIPIYLLYLYKKDKNKIFLYLILLSLFTALMYLFTVIPFGGLGIVFRRGVEIAGFNSYNLISIVSVHIKLFTSQFTDIKFIINLSPYIVSAILYTVMFFHFSIKDSAKKFKTILPHMIYSYSLFLLLGINWLFSWYYLLPLTLCLIYFGLNKNKSSVEKIYWFIIVVMIIGLLPYTGIVTYT